MSLKNKNIILLSNFFTISSKILASIKRILGTEKEQKKQKSGNRPRKAFDSLIRQTTRSVLEPWLRGQGTCCSWGGQGLTHSIHSWATHKCSNSRSRGSAASWPLQTTCIHTDCIHVYMVYINTKCAHTRKHTTHKWKIKIFFGGGEEKWKLPERPVCKFMKKSEKGKSKG